MRPAMCVLSPYWRSHHGLVQCRLQPYSQAASKLPSRSRAANRAADAPVIVDVSPPANSVTQPKRVLLTADLHLKMANLDTALQFWHEHLLPQAEAHDADIAILGDIFHR